MVWCSRKWLESTFDLVEPSSSSVMRRWLLSEILNRHYLNESDYTLLSSIFVCFSTFY